VASSLPFVATTAKSPKEMGEKLGTMGYRAPEVCVCVCVCVCGCGWVGECGGVGVWGVGDYVLRT